jgi:Holliday junction resolvasome RuvABC ATP-dependent DNA helicase subunit
MWTVKDAQQAIVDLARLGLRGDTSSVRQYVLRLLRRIGGDDDPSLRTTLTQLVVESQQGGPRFVRKATDRRESSSVPVFPARVSEVIQQVVLERSHLDSLARVGIEPTRSLLLTGAPGTGKTMTAHYIATALKLPIITIDLASVMSSFLGKTGQNLREALEYARNRPCVLLVDEFDALAKRRDDPTDVGELKRIVNVLLLELERWPPHGLLIAATNHPELLDRAIWRRFDKVVSLPLPSARERVEILQRAFVDHGVENVDQRALQVLSDLTANESGSEVVRLVREVARARALRGGEGIADRLRDMLLERLVLSNSAEGESRALCAGVLHDSVGLSQREVGARMGVSHVTVGKLIRQYRARLQAATENKSQSTPQGTDKRGERRHRSR